MKRFTVIGNPVAHSLSPRIHALFASQTGIELTYEKLEAPVNGFVRTVERFFAAGGAGCNVTVPFKEAAFAWVQEHDERAGTAGAVNTIVRVGSAFRGSNTDGIGLLNDLKRLGVEVLNARLLILGAGGAVRGVIGPLLGDAPREIVLVNRTPQRVQDLIERFEDPRLRACGSERLTGSFDLVVNGTSAGLAGNLPSVPRDALRGAFCYDMAYGRASARFLAWVSDAGARASADGLGMLVEQAAGAFLLWHDVLPQTAPVLATLRRELEEQRP